MSQFCHLHCHSEYSLLDGMSRIDDMVQRARELDQPAIALTDHGVMFGAIEFYRAAKQHGVKPVMGVEAYLAARRMQDRDPKLDRQRFHMLLLAENQTGYGNLLKLSSVAQLEGFYGRPRIDKEVLAAHSEGLIATTGCLAAEVPRTLIDRGEEAAYQKLKWYLDIFGRDRFFLELQGHDISELRTVNRTLLEWAKKHEIGLIATNDVHYVRREDASSHDVLLCIQTRDNLSNPNRMRLTPEGSYYIASREEMAALFRGFDDELIEVAFRNSVEIANRCEVNLDTEGYHLPAYPVPEGYDAESYLRYLVEKGVEERYGAERAKSDPVIRERVERELGIIHNMGFDNYFLIVWDLCAYAAQSDIWWNVRGSGAGSLIAYALRITNIDPIKNDLIFERFLNPARVSMPDIDIDFPDDRRSEMIEYTVRKYGDDRCAAIITFGTLGARAAVRDVARALEVPLSEADRVARMVPNVPGKPVQLDKLLFDETTLEEWPTQATELREVYQSDETIRSLLETAMKLEGQTRHASTHAAGIVIADKPIVEYAPLHRPTKGAEGGPIGQVVQFDMNIVESIGLLKVDFLGLSTLTIMRRACELIEERHGRKLDLSTIPYERRPDDPEADADVMEAYRLLQDGHTVGVFQVEGAGLRRTLQEMQPTEFEHIIAAISLYRPGPMEYIPNYIRRMHGKEPLVYHHPALKPILENTFAIIVYQEQIMRIASELGGYSPGEADLMRRAVSKKKAKDIEKHRGIFVEGAVKKGIDRGIAEKIYGDIEYFARYGFNKCLPGNVEVLDAGTGRLVRMEDLYNGKARLDETITCHVEGLQLDTGRVEHIMNNGIKPVFKLTTALGRTIEATANHPFYTFDGWRLLGELEEGDSIAVPRRLPVEGKKEWREHEVIALGHLLAGKPSYHPCAIHLDSRDEVQRNDFIRAAEQFEDVRCSVGQRKDSFSVCAEQSTPESVPGIITWARRVGIWNRETGEREIPGRAFELVNAQVALLLSRMWEGAGRINAPEGHLCYPAVSERLAHQIQHLLLRLNILSRVERLGFLQSAGRTEYQVVIDTTDEIARFAEEVGTHFLSEERRAALQAVCVIGPIGSETKESLRSGPEALVPYETGPADRPLRQLQGTSGLLQEASGPAPASTGGDAAPQTIVHPRRDGDIYWDRIVHIEYVGEKPTYDLEVPGTHNFVANDILVHNSHAADYAVITVQTAYLKSHYPVEYMCALLEVEFDDSNKVPVFLSECRRLGIDVLPPDINRSGAKFTIEENHRTGHLPADDCRGWAIRVGMGAIKNVGLGAVEEILAEREANGSFASLDDFCERVDLRHLNRRVIECLAKVGCFDNLVRNVAPEAPRETVVALIDRMMGISGQIHEAADVGQMSLFDMVGSSGAHTKSSVLSPLPDVGQVIPKQRLLDEKELLGLYISEHPLQQVAEEVGGRISCFCGEITSDQVGQNVVIAGLLTDLRLITTKKGERMAFARLEDLQGEIEVVIFPRTYEKSHEWLAEDNILLVRGKVDARDERMSVLADVIQLYEPQVNAAGPEAPNETSSEQEPSLLDGMRYRVTITLQRSEEHDKDVLRLNRILEVLQQFPGEDRVYLRCVFPDGRAVLLDFPNLSTGWNAALRDSLVGQGADFELTDVTPDSRRNYRKSA